MKLSTAAALGVAAGLLLAACQVAATPTPTPAPAGAVPLILTADTVKGGKNLTPEEKAGGLSCVLNNRFAKNEEIVWRARIIDPTTGDPMDDTMLSSVVVHLPDQEIAMEFGGHPRSDPVDFFWATSFDIPESYPTGLLAYTIEATALDGRTGTYNQFAVTSASLQVTDDVRPVITPGPSPTT